MEDPPMALVHKRNNVYEEGPVHGIHLSVLGVKPLYVSGRQKRMSDITGQKRQTIEAQEEETLAVAAR